MRTTAVEAEWRWLQGKGDEPDWPIFPPARVGVREKRFIGGAPPATRRNPKAEAQFNVDDQAAAIWLSKFRGRELVAPDWLRPAAGYYRDWTSAHNGAGLNQFDELSQRASEWNSAYFDLVARSLSGLTADAIDRLCLDPVLPDEAFLDVMAELLLSLDAVYLSDKGFGEADAVRLRAALAERMEKTPSWLNHERRPGYGMEYHLSNALAAVFLNSAGFRQASRCYVTAIGMPRAVTFIPLLADLAAKAPSLSVALMALSIGSVSPDYPFLEFGVGALHACLKRCPDDTKFWVDYGVGKKFCGWIEGIISANGSKVLDDTGVRIPVEEIVSNLFRLGVVEAANLETALSR